MGDIVIVQGRRRPHIIGAAFLGINPDAATQRSDCDLVPQFARPEILRCYPIEFVTGELDGVPVAGGDVGGIYVVHDAPLVGFRLPVGDAAGAGGGIAGRAGVGGEFDCHCGRHGAGPLAFHNQQHFADVGVARLVDAFWVVGYDDVLDPEAFPQPAAHCRRGGVGRHCGGHYECQAPLAGVQVLFRQHKEPVGVAGLVHRQAGVKLGFPILQPGTDCFAQLLVPDVAPGKGRVHNRHLEGFGFQGRRRGVNARPGYRARVEAQLPQTGQHFQRA